MSFLVAGSYALLLSLLASVDGVSGVGALPAAIGPQTGLLALLSLAFATLAVYQTLLDRFVAPMLALVLVFLMLTLPPAPEETGDAVVLFAAAGETLLVLTVAEHLVRRAIRRFR